MAPWALEDSEDKSTPFLAPQAAYLVCSLIL